MNHQQRSIMGQIKATKKEAQHLRESMKDAARIATLTYPATRASDRPADDHTAKKKA